MLPLHDLNAQSFNAPKHKKAVFYKKNSIAIGMDYVRHAYPAAWHNNGAVEKINYDNNSSLYSHSALWLGYYLNNTYSIRAYTTFLYQRGSYNPIYQMPNNFLIERQVTFYDITVGYNLLNNCIQKVSGWVYIGAGYAKGDEETQTYIPGWWDRLDSGKNINKWYPTMQIMVKYNPIQNIYVGIGGTYRHVYNDFQTFSLNLSAGIQFGVFNRSH